jgi:hypothetical protein
MSLEKYLSYKSALTSFVPSKRTNSALEEPPAKRHKGKGGGETSGRKLFLNQLRAICDRRAVNVKVDDLLEEGEEVGVVDGREVLRLYLRDRLQSRYRLSDCECRHGDGRHPPEMGMCQTGGTVDNGKASSFVMSDFKKDLYAWLDGRKRYQNFVATDPEFDADDDEDDDLGLGPSEPLYDSRQYPSSQPHAGQFGYRRKTTKQRLTILQYLHSHSHSRADFISAFRQLGDPDLYLVHLCGCGINTQSLKGACVRGSHMKLASAELNRDHIHYHFVLENASSKESYEALLAGMKGSLEGKYDDIF